MSEDRALDPTPASTVLIDQNAGKGSRVPIKLLGRDESVGYYCVTNTPRLTVA